MSATSGSRRARIDASFLHPQALSKRSWLMRVPLLGRLADVKTWWNPLWIEEFDLITPHRPAAIASLLDEQLPSVPGLAFAGSRAAGYVWSDGFTVYRLTVVGRWTAYAMLLFYLLWALGGVLALVGSIATVAEGRFSIWFPVIGVGLLVGPLVIFALLAGRGERKMPRSRESEFILAFLRDAIGAEFA